ncbi:MAG TPA: hypothetical protein PKM21_04485 [Anaerolineales bacterium]|nr:hypothetical protein [Anaerolineales bacterium]
MPIHLPFDVVTPGLSFVIIGGSILVLIILTILIALVEGVALTLLGWDSFKRAYLVALLMNFISTCVGAVLLFILPQEQNLWWVLISFALSLLIEGLVLVRFKRRAARQNWTAALVANLASYLILIAPIYFFGAG